MRDDDLELRVAWQTHVGVGPVADTWFDSVVQRHRAADRHYHGVRHLRWVVRQVSAIAHGVEAERIEDLSAVVAAACFHDAVYDARSAGNEAASAELARRALAEMGWVTDRVERVAALVLATATHELDADSASPPAPLDTAILLAADLSILAADPAAYGDYVRGVRREYRHVDDESWRAGRSAVLGAFVEREHLFHPELGLGSWERRGRGNLRAELATLRDRTAVDRARSGAADDAHRTLRPNPDRDGTRRTPDRGDHSEEGGDGGDDDDHPASVGPDPQADQS